jgi:hypothetical protein
MYAPDGDSINYFEDGFSYSAQTDTWDRLPPSPLQARALAAGAWTGQETPSIPGAE